MDNQPEPPPPEPLTAALADAVHRAVAQFTASDGYGHCFSVCHTTAARNGDNAQLPSGGRSDVRFERIKRRAKPLPLH